MNKDQLCCDILDNSNDLVWVVNAEFNLIYANRTYLDLMKEVTGGVMGLNSSVFVEGFGEGYIEKWKAYYLRALSGEGFEIEEHFYNPETKETQYGHIAFSPIRDEAGEIEAVACRNTDISSLMRQKDHASNLMDASLDVFCTIDEAGNFVFVSAASTEHWGYSPEELTGKPYRDLIIEEDREKTDGIAAEILAGREVKSFSNRYRKKNGGIAYNLWSVRWDHESRLMYCVARDEKEKIEEEQHLKLLESVITNAQDAVLITEADTLDEPGPKIIYANEAFTKMTGYSAEEVIGKTPRILQGPKSNKEELANLGKAIRNGESYECTTINYKKNGDEFWVNFKITPVQNEKGWHTHLIAIERDVTERKQQEEKLIKAKELAEENEDKMKQSQKLAHIGSWYYDVVNQVSQWSEETFNIWGLNKDITSINLVDHQKLVHPKDWERFNAVINNATEKGVPYKMELELLREDGSYKTVNTIGEPIFDENHKVIAFKGTTQDISDRIIIENELRSAKEKAEKSLKLLEDYKYALEQSAIIAFTDNKGIITSVNDNFCKISKYEREEIIGKTHQLINSKHHPKEFFTDLWKTIASGKVWRGEIKNKAKDATYYWVDTTIVPFLDELNKPIQYLAIRFDITERKKAEESLNAATERLRIATSGGNIGIWDWDVLNDHLIWDETMYRIFGVEESEFQGAYKAFEATVHPDDLDDTNEKVQNAIKGLSKFKSEFRIVRQDKSIRYISGEAVVVYEDTAGKPTRLIGYNLDITERKKAEKEKTSLQETIENSLNEIYTFDAETYLFSYVNQGAMLNLGYSEQEIKTLTPLDLKPDYTETSFNQLIAPLRSNQKEKIVFFTNHKRKDGSLYPVEVHLQLIPDGNTKRFLAIILDVTERKKAEEKLLNALKEKSNILESISDNFYALNSKFEFTYMNSSCAELLQVEAPEIINENLFDQFPALKNTLFETQLLETQRTGKPVKFEFFFKHYQRWFSESIYPNKDGFSVYFYDVTKIKEAEKQILEKNEQLTRAFEEKNNILESIGDAFFAVDEDWTITYWNKQSEIIMGKNKECVVGKNLWELYPEAIDTDFYRQYHKALSTGETTNFEDYYEALDIWVEVTAYPSENGLSIYLKDVTLRKAADIRLLQANERFEKVTEATNDAIWDWDIQNNTQYLGKGFKKLFGYELEDVSTSLSSWMERIHKEDLDKVTQSLDKTLESNTDNWVSEYRYLKADGTYAVVIDRGITIRNTNGKPIRMIGAMTDITEQKAQEEHLISLNESLKTYAKELERSNEELEQFAFVTSHDLQEPLRMISSFMDQLKRKYEDQLDEKGLQYIEFAIDGAKRMKQIILDLLLYSRANNPTEKIEVVDLNELLSDFRQLRRRYIGEKKATIISSELPVLRTHKAPMLQIIHSLLDNALKYSKDDIPPYIEVSSSEKDTEWEFMIKDNGIGVDSQFFDKIFLLFQRLHNRNQHDGTGIGLSIAKRSVEFLGGRIWLESKVGEGSAFYFTIPKK